ncbi:curlin [Methylobacterium sp. P31]
MRFLISAIVLLVGLGTRPVFAQSIEGFVQIGPDVQPITVTQNSSLNFVGIVQIGGTPQSTVTQSGLINAAGIWQVGSSTTATVSQSGAQNLSTISQFGASNTTALSQFGAFNLSFVKQARR